IVGKAAGEVEGFLDRHTVDAGEQFGCARPADFDPAKQISLRPRHLENTLRLEARMRRTEDLRVRPETDLGAAPIWRAADLFHRPLRLAALERLGVERLAARDFDLEPLRKRVDDRYADAVQAARSVVDFGIEFSARVQRAHDHFEGGLLRKLR